MRSFTTLFSDNDLNHSQVLSIITNNDSMGGLNQNPNVYFDDRHTQGGQSVSHNGFILAPNGNLYSIPSDDVSVMEYNPTTDTYLKFDGNLPLTSSKFVGACFSRITGMIYLMPYTLTKFYKIDPFKRTVGQLAYGSISDFYTTLIEANNGKMYALPRDASSNVIEFDPITEKWRNVVSNDANGGWCQGFLGDNGMIYGVPYTYTQGFCRFNPMTFALDIIAPSANLSSSLPKYWSGCMGKNKKIYCIPAYQDVIEVLDTVTSQVTLVNYTGAWSSKWNGACMGPNGKIYAAPYSSSTVLEINPDTNSAKEIIPVTVNTWAGSARQTGAILHPNGKIYMAPHTNQWTVIVDFGRGNGSSNTYLNRHINYQ